MKRLLVIPFLAVFIISCSSDDDNNTSLDLSLLYYTWNRDSEFLCPTQNNVTFNEDGSYVQLSSGNSCDFNENDTYQFTGTYSVSGDNISFNQLTEAVIEEGEGNPLTVDEIPVELISQKITILTETTLVIERVIRDELSNQTVTNNTSYVR